MKKTSCTVSLSLEQVQSFLDREFTGYTVEVCSGTDGIDIFYRYVYYETVSNLYLAVELIEQSSPLEVKKMKSFYEWKQKCFVDMTLCLRGGGNMVCQKKHTKHTRNTKIV